MIKQKQQSLSTYFFSDNEAFPPIDEYFPVKEADILIERESYNKHLFRPNTYLHKWWARRSGVAFRYILKQLVENASLRDYYAPGGLENKVIYDPMIGGGTTIHEAIRMGASVIGVDIDPIPILQTQATLTEYDLVQLNSDFKDLFSFLNHKIGHYFLTKCPKCQQFSNIQFVLYGLRKKCDCSEYIVIDNFIIREGKNYEIKICPECSNLMIDDNHHCFFNNNFKIIEKSEKICPNCNKPLDELLDEPFSDRYQPLIIFAKCGEHGQFFKTIDNYDLELIKSAKKEYLDNCDFNLNSLKIKPGPKSNDLIRRNIHSYDELFTPRQLLYLKYSIDYLNNNSTLEKVPFGLLISTSLDFNSLLCGYKGAHLRRPGAIRHVFSHHAYTFPYTALENNPLFPQPNSGNLLLLYNDRISNAIEWSKAPIERAVKNKQTIKVNIEGEIDRGIQCADISNLNNVPRGFFIKQADSSKFSLPKKSVDFIVTDPPYFDNVQYSDLSNFFRVWLQHLLPNESNWQYSEMNSAVSNSNSYRGNYAKMVYGIWKKCYSPLKPPNGRLIFTFHHWKGQAWAELAISLLKANYRLINSYVIKSENPTSVHIKGINSLKHDSVMVCAPKGWKSNGIIWQRPIKISTIDSHDFIKMCTEVVGWVLQEGLDEEEIYNLCNEIIGVGNGSTSS